MTQCVGESFCINRIVPDILDVPPTHLAHVQFESGKAMLGNELTPASLINQPSVTWPCICNDSDQLYTLIFLDADAPSRSDPAIRSYLHWLVCNVRGSDLKSGQTFATYMGSAPGPGSGLHRYIFLVHPQLKGQVTLPKTLPTMSPERMSFNVRMFSSQHGLGNALAGNFYQAQPDSYSDSFWASQPAFD